MSFALPTTVFLELPLPVKAGQVSRLIWVQSPKIGRPQCVLRGAVQGFAGGLCGAAVVAMAAMSIFAHGD